MDEVQNYPLWRDYRLYELDGANCKLITGMEYNELRLKASTFFAGEVENQNSPLWDAVLLMGAREVWDHRERQRVYGSRVSESHSCAGCGDSIELNERWCESCEGGSFSHNARTNWGEW